MGIILDNVSYTYQEGTPFASAALSNVNLSIEDGSYTAIIGHTGSGKSTILQLLNGLLVPTKGSVRVFDTLITSTSVNKQIRQIRKQVGLVFQFAENQIFEETVLKDVAFGPQNFGVSVEEAEAIAREKLALVGTDGLDAFVAGVGTGGTISGVSHALKAANSNIQVFAVEADESAILSGEKPGPHKIQGISAGFIPETLDTEAYDGIVRVTSDNALALGREIGGKEGFLVGISSAAAIYAAIEVAKKLGAGKKVLALAPDNGERYLSTALYEFEV